ncbi:3-deoxy-D-manno-octulosonic acid transferase [Hellea balneolensis]|uniref:3-deoxy-D-manno-octulosonic acid transferase n=1 Tax=Hellea balneolensis TaxID=287478 RepID=UPI00042182C9|nr:3-deoxy-D-manno-octulosonic acid transferase [Hellea balneolensis]
MSETGLIRAYSGLTKAIAPALPIWLKRRALKGKEDPARQEERFGIASRNRPDGQLFWMHGASVGEVTMLLPLIDKVLAEYPMAHVLVTSGTTTSAELMAKRLPKRAFHQYVPLDTAKAVTAFLDHWKPDLALWAESEIWPNLLLQTKARGTPMALINARMSERSVQGWFKRRKSAQSLFGCFDVILAGDEATANGLSWLLGQEVESAGSLKEAAPNLPVETSELTILKSEIGERPVWCAASTHKGEEEIILAAHKDILAKHPNTLLILALRHPERSEEIQALMDFKNVSIRSKKTELNPESSVFLFDTIGEMGLAYSLSDVTFVCGSLVKGLMGHNPLEPARFCNAVLTGAHISSFADSYMSMIAFDAAQRILSPTKVGHAVSDLFSDPERLARQQRLAFDYAQGRNAVLEYVWEKLSPILPAKSGEVI